MKSQVIGLALTSLLIANHGFAETNNYNLSGDILKECAPVADELNAQNQTLSKILHELQRSNQMMQKIIPESAQVDGNLYAEG
ncbi:TPA: hypothetical protein JBF89_13205 [Legionella pneumophila]|nr:hypothetical protein [Legionella pneumophila]HAU0349922.1 hypothetical protein [Legionella pneumophila]HAU0353413.1 hypothetical protein [Legionella pneumophila]HAU0359502.1 hypothetical protein [Legionella pneumophila]HAU0368059.1 hypothetical protein [Legionella pneumophila]